MCSSDLAEAGDPAWGYESVLGIYRRIEDWHGANDPRRRGVGGPVFVCSATEPQPVALAMLEAGQTLGLPRFDSPNGEMMEGRGGVAINDLIVRNERRVSVFRSYVQPRRGQPNLSIRTYTMVSKLILSGTSVVGVEVIQDGEFCQYRADREVILSLGAIKDRKSVV